jgi:hypothetical protein
MIGCLADFVLGASNEGKCLHHDFSGLLEQFGSRKLPDCRNVLDRRMTGAIRSISSCQTDETPLLQIAGFPFLGFWHLDFRETSNFSSDVTMDITSNTGEYDHGLYLPTGRWRTLPERLSRSMHQRGDQPAIQFALNALALRCSW